MAKTNHTSIFVSFVPRLNLKKVLFLKTCAFVLSYSIMNCDLRQLWFCHFVSEAMQTWTLHIYLVIILQISHIYIIVLVVHPPLLFKQGRLHRGGQNFRWKLSLIWFCPKKWQKNSFQSKLCSIDLTRLGLIMCLSLPEILFVQTYLQLKQNPHLKRPNLAGATISTDLVYKI